MRATLRLAALTLCLVAFGADFAAAQNQPPPPPQRRDTFKPDEIIHEGHKFFCATATASSTPKTPATGVCSGRGLRSDLITAAKVPAR
jgi:hypothetical protein